MRLGIERWISGFPFVSDIYGVHSVNAFPVAEVDAVFRRPDEDEGWRLTGNRVKPTIRHAAGLRHIKCM
jgi:hypothetical protein